MLSRVFTAALGMLALTLGGVALAVALGVIQVDGLAGRGDATTEPVALEVEADDPALEARDELAVSALEPDVPESEPQREPDPLEPGAFDPVGHEQPDTEREAAQQARLAAEAERDRQRSAMIEADRRARALKRAREEVSVVMYSTNWCPSCTKARDYMLGAQIPFVEHDVDASPSASLEHKRLNPKGSVPTISVEGELLIGFSSQRLERMIDAAAEERVR